MIPKRYEQIETDLVSKLLDDGWTVLYLAGDDGFFMSCQMKEKQKSSFINELAKVS